MTCKGNEVTTIVLVVAEFTVILYPLLGGGDGGVQETTTVSGPVCSAMRLVGGAMSTIIITRRCEDTHM